MSGSRTIRKKKKTIPRKIKINSCYKYDKLLLIQKQGIKFFSMSKSQSQKK